MHTTQSSLRQNAIAPSISTDDIMSVGALVSRLKETITRVSSLRTRVEELSNRLTGCYPPRLPQGNVPVKESRPLLGEASADLHELDGLVSDIDAALQNLDRGL